MKKILLYVVVMLFLTAGISVAADDEESWLTIGGDLRLRYDNLEGTVHDYIATDGAGAVVAVPGYEVKNDALFLGRFGLNITAVATEEVTVHARLLMYKVWGHETNAPVQGAYFADRAAGPLDGTVGHVPGDSAMRADQMYATWSNIGGAPVWISAGRRPSTGGVPNNIRQNLEKTGREGNSGIVMDYAFDGLVVGYSPTLDIMPGAYAKLGYGKGFDSGYVSTNQVNGQFSVLNSLKDTDYVSANVVPYSTDNLHVDLQAQKGFHITDYSVHTQPGYQVQTTNLGDISWWGGTVVGKAADFNLFASAAQSKTSPNDHQFAGYGLLWDTYHTNSRKSLVGSAVYVGGRYDIAATGTKIGAEYNWGSQNWVGMVPAGDDIWTSKLGTRGSVYEVYIIQELNKKPIMKRGKAFFRIGYQQYTFDYTGSNNWMGAAVKMSQLNLTNQANAQLLAPVTDAKDLYATFDVLF